jgi:PAS domain S-box-containing protein
VDPAWSAWPSAPLRVGAVSLSASDDAQTQREKLARVVLDAMYQFVGLLDAEGRTLEINRAALEGAGLRLEHIRGRPFWEARWFQVSRESIEQQRDFVRRARGGEFIRCDLEVYGEAAGDRTIVVDFSLLPVRDDRGRVAFLLAEGRNITAKKLAEAEVARKNAELQRLLDTVRQMDRLKSDLFANVSHELRTPLALILGPTDELLAGGANLTEPQRRQLQVVRRSAATLLKHVDDLLDLARLDARKVDLRCEPVDLAALLRVLAEPFQTLAPQRGLRYLVSAPPSLPALLDPEKFERILLNLLSNAFKFTPPGGRVRCALEPLGDDRCLLSVQDSGPGVPPEQRQTVFERFRQLQQGTTREHGGTGLGLAIAKEFVDLHHGSIAVTAAPGGGALFQVELPLRPPPGSFIVTRSPEAPDPADALLDGVLAELQPPESGDGPATLAPTPTPTPVPPCPNPSAADATAADERPAVLVVEDNPEMRRFVTDALRGECRVAAVADGQAALERLLAQPRDLPDLVVTDLMLPRLGGDQLVEAMRARAELADLPVLVLSARGDEALRTRLLTDAVQDYVTKPFSAQELRARVRNLAGMKHTRDVLKRELAVQGGDLTHMTRRLIASRRALQESEQRWWTVYEHSPVGLALIDADGPIRTANPAFRAMLGYSAEELRAGTLRQITPEEDRASTQERVTRLLAGTVREYHVQRRYLRRDGTPVWTNTSVALVPGLSEAAPLLLVVAEDISEQKRAEQALAQTRAELTQVSRASTLGELAASIAHEVNQPLAAIATNGQAGLRWLEEGGASSRPSIDEARDSLRRIVRDANRAGEVITRIRAFLRRGELPKAPVDLAQVAEETLALLRGEAAARGIGLQLRLPDAALAPLPPVRADRVQLQQLLLNLVMNALESIDRRAGPRREVEIALVAEPPDRLRVDVTDSGAGIDPVLAERLFEAFQTTKPGGMGMGLAICRSIVESHGGRLWTAPPSPGEGATFCFTLPVDAGDAPQAP